MNLKPINIARMPILDSGSFIDRYITDFINQNIATGFDQEFKELHDSLVAQAPQFNKAIKQIRAKAESVELLKLDEHRDKKVTTLRKANAVYETSDDAAEQKAYLEIKTVLNNYKNIEKANYEAESLGIDKMIADLRNNNYLGFIQVLGLETHIDKLEASNIAFKAKFNTRSTETISTEVFDTKVLRKNIFATYKDLADYVLIMAKRKPQVPQYKQILDVLNNGREYFANIMARKNTGTPPTPAAA